MRGRLRSRELPLATCVGIALAVGSSTPLLASNATGVVPVGSGNGYLRQDRAPSMSVRNCNDAGVGSLREALQGDVGIIDLRSLPCTTISLTSGALPIAHDVQMLGPGAGRLFIDGMGHSRVFESTAKTSPLLATKDLTIRNGAATDRGGCIYTTGTLHIEDTNVYSCGVFSQDVAKGGAIYALGAVELERSYVAGGSVTSESGEAMGGGIYAQGLLHVHNTTIASNVANSKTANSVGGGVFARGQVDIDSSTISGNIARMAGGVAVFSGNSESGKIVDSTISGNRGLEVIGGVLTDRPLLLSNSTVAFNCAFATRAGGSDAVGIGVHANSGSIELQSSIVANNTICGSSASEPAASFDPAYDISTSAGVPLGGANSLVVTSAVALPPDTLRLDPLLGPLNSNGGRTLTHALLAGSPAIDAGNNTADLHYDQRGGGAVSPNIDLPWTSRIVGGSADIGAYEAQAVGITRRVTVCDDGGNGSLRDIVAQSASGDVIDLTRLGCARIVLKNQIDIPLGNLTLLGTGSGLLEIDGDRRSRVLNHSGYGTLRLEGLTISQGALQRRDGDVASGGCIHSDSRVIASDLVLSQCHASSANGACLGGAIAAQGLDLELSRMTDNVCESSGAAAIGGAIYAGKLLLGNSLLARNRASADAPDFALRHPLSTAQLEGVVGGLGGGFFALFDVSISGSTVAANHARVGGGGDAYALWMQSSTVSGNSADSGAAGLRATLVEVVNSTIAFNSSTASGMPLAAGLATNSLGELFSSIVFGNTSGDVPFDISSFGPIGLGTNNLVGAADIALPAETLRVDPLLAPLADNGGPTPTHALSTGSPAINAGRNSQGFANDQRGTGFPRVIDDAADIGSFEMQTDVIFSDGFQGISHR